jgi:hypothetical protein
MAINYLGSHLRFKKEIVSGDSVILEESGIIANFTIYRDDDYSIKATVSWNGSTYETTWIQGKPISEQDVADKMCFLIASGNLILKNNFNTTYNFVIIKEV